MTVFVALLCAVNVGGTGKLPMTDLKAICDRAGLNKVRTYIASGNCVFESDADEAEVKARLEAGLASYAGKRIGVLVRAADALARIRAANPFPAAAGNRVVAIFLDEPPPADTVARITGREHEEIGLGTREIYVHYPDGIANSRLKLPRSLGGTARNMNTIARLIAMTEGQP